MPKTLNKDYLENPEVKTFIDNLKNFSSDSGSKYFISNFTNISEKIDQLEELGIESCEVEELYKFLLNENQNESINNITKVCKKDVSEGFNFIKITSRIRT